MFPQTDEVKREQFKRLKACGDGVPVDEEEIVKENIGMRRNREIGSFFMLRIN